MDRKEQELLDTLLDGAIECAELARTGGEHDPAVDNDYESIRRRSYAQAALALTQAAMTLRKGGYGR